MSKNIDQRVVQMQFDNKQFENGVSETLGTLNKLKQALKFDSASKSLSDVSDASKKLTFAELAASVEKIANKFSAFGILGVTVLQNIANQAVRTGEQLVKSLTIDQAAAGWEKYNQETANVQTLINATGKSQDEVYEYLDKLMWYSDETSYGFTDMTQALATMSAAGGDIDDLIPLLMGVANATSYAGKGAKEYSRIMQYAVNQAYSTGYMGLQDWNTIAGATVNSEALVKTLIQAGEELGKIKKGQITLSNFRDSLKKGWLDTEVMEKGFGEFAKVTEEIYAGMEAGLYETYADGLEAIGDKYGEVAYKGAKASQEAKTLTEAIDATKDAVGSGWMKTFELMFGRYEEATKRWTQLCNDELLELFASSSELRNDILAAWSEAGGADDLWQGIINIFEAIKNIITPIREAIAETFGFGDVEEGKETLLKITDAFVKFTEKLVLTKDQMNKLKDICSGLFSILGTAANFVKGAIVVIAGFGKAIIDVVGGPITTFIAGIGNFVEGIKTSSDQSNLFVEVAKKVKDILTDIVNTVSEKVSALKETIKGVYDYILNSKITPILERIFDVYKKALDILIGAIEKLGDTLSDLGLDDAFENFLKSGAIVGVIALITGMNTSVKNVTGTFKTLGDTVKTSVTSVSDGINGILDTIKGVATNISDTIKTFGDIGKSIPSVLDTTKESLKTWQREIKATIILEIAAALGIIAAAMVTLSALDTDDLANSFAAITGLITDLVAAFVVLNRVDLGSSFSFKKGEGFSKASSAASEFLKLAAALLIVAKALQTIGELEPEQIGLALISISGMMAGMVVVVKKLNKEEDIKKSAGSLILFGIAMVIMAEAVNKFGSMDWDELLIGLGGFAGTMFIVIKAIEYMSEAGDLIKVAAGMLILGEAMKVFAEAVHEMGGSNKDELMELVTGVGGVVVILAALAGFIAVTKNSNKDMIKMAAGMILLGIAIQQLAKPVKELAELGFEKLIVGLDGLGAILIEIAFAMKFMEGNFKAAAAMIVMAVAIQQLVKPVLEMANTPWEQLKVGLGALAILLVEIAIAMAAMDTNIGGAATMLIMAAAITVLADALTGLGKMSLKQVGVALTAVAGALMIFIGASYAAKPIILVMAALAACMIGFAAALALAGVGIQAIGIGLVALSGGVTAACAAIVIAVASVIEILNMLATGVPQIFTNFGLSIINGLNDILMAITTNVLNLIETIVESVCSIFKTITDTIVDCFTSIGSIDYEVIKNGLMALAGGLTIFIAAGYLAAPVAPILLVLSTALLEFGLALDAIVLAISGAAVAIGFIGEKFPWLKKIIIDAVTKIQEKFEAFWAKVKEIKDSITTFFGDIKNALKMWGDDIVEVFKTIGKMIIEGLLSGLWGAFTMLIDGIKNIATGLKNKFKEELEINSPSKVFAEYGGYIDEGLSKGLSDGNSGVLKTIGGIANGLTSTFDNSKKEFYDLGSTLGDSLSSGLNNNIQSKPITPVLDLDESSLSNINMLGSFTETIKNAFSNLSDIDTEQTINEHITFDTLTIKGVNNQNEFVASSDYAVDEIISSLLRKEARV